MLRLSPIFVLLLCTAYLRAQEPFFPPERLEELRREITFGDASDSPPEDPAPPTIPLDPGPVVQVLIGSVLVIGLGGLLYLILRSHSRRKAKPSAATVSDASEAVEDASLVREGVDPARIARAEAAGRYDLAVRLLYLHTLQRLDAAGLIRYRRDLGNHVYRRQLPDGAIRTDFALVATAYERHWFGQYGLDAAAYGPLRNRFDALDRRISETDAVA